MEKTLQLAMENKDYIVEMRRHFHCNPEPSEHEVNTSKRIYEELEKMGLAAPQITYVVHELREHGVEIADDLTTVAEARDAILEALKKQQRH